MANFRIIQHRDNSFTVERRVAWFFWVTESTQDEDFYGQYSYIHPIQFYSLADAEQYIRNEKQTILDNIEASKKPTRKVVGYY